MGKKKNINILMILWYIGCLLYTSAFNHYHMMITAENVCDKYGITREELDEFSANSQQKCEAEIGRAHV